MDMKAAFKILDKYHKIMNKTNETILKLVPEYVEAQEAVGETNYQAILGRHHGVEEDEDIKKAREIEAEARAKEAAKNHITIYKPIEKPEKP